MKKIIMGLMFVFVAGICFGQYTVIVRAINSGADSRPTFAAETFTRFLETSAVNLGYTIIDRAAIDEAAKNLEMEPTGSYSYSQLQRIGRELNADFLIYGVLYRSFLDVSVVDIKNWREVAGSERLRMSKNEKTSQKRIDKFIGNNIGTVDKQQEYQQELAKRQAGPLPQDAWRNNKIYVGVGTGIGIGAGVASVDGETYGSFGANFGGTLRADFGKPIPHMTKRGYTIQHMGFGTGLRVSGSEGNVSVMIPLEYRGAERYDRMELGLGAGAGVIFGSAGFSLPIIIDGTIGWNIGPGIVFLEGQVGYSFLSTGGSYTDSIGLIGSINVGYKLGFWK